MPALFSLPKSRILCGGLLVIAWLGALCLPAIAVIADSQSGTTPAQQQQVAAGPPDHFGLTPAPDTTITAGKFMRFKIRVEDSANNATPLLQNRILLLSSSPTAQASGPQPEGEQASGEFYLPDDHDTPITQLAVSSSEESLYVDYRNTDVNGGSAHLVIVLSKDASPTLSGNTNVFVVAAGVDSMVSAVTGPSSPVAADGVDAGLINVTVRDEFGNPIGGASVALTVDGDATVSDSSGTTGADGTWQTSVMDTTAETVTVTATVGDTLELDAKPQIVFEAGPVTHYDVLEATNSTTAGTLFNVTITARDQFGNRAMDADNSVALVAVDPLDTDSVLPDSLLIPSATLSAGRVDVPERYDVARDIVIRARDASSNEGFSGTIIINPAPAARLVYVKGDTLGVAPGDTVPLVAQVKDSFGNSVPGVTVYFDVTSGGGEILPPSDVPSDTNGESGVLFRTDTLAGENRARGSIDNGFPEGDETVVFVVQTTPDSVHHYRISLAETTLAAGESMSITVQAYDRFNNPITDDDTTPIVLTTDTGNGFFNGSPEPLTDTLTGGAFTTTFKYQTAETVRIEVQTDGDPGVNGTSKLITVTNGPAYKVEKITVQADTTGVLAGGIVTLKAQVLDQLDNSVPGYGSVFFAIGQQDPGGGATLSDSDTSGVKWLFRTTDASGYASVKLHTSSSAGVNTADVAILDRTPPDRLKTYSVTTVAGDIDHFDIEPSDTSVTANDPIDFMVTALDAQNNTVDTGIAVTLSVVPDDGGTFTPSPFVLVNGMRSGTLSSYTSAGQIRIRAEAGGADDSSATITVHPDVPANISAEASRDTLTANGRSKSEVKSSSITDTWGNVVAAGQYITVSIAPETLGSIIAADADPFTDGIQLVTNPDGIISFLVESKTEVGPATVTMTSVANEAATASIPIVMAPKPVLVCETAPVPNVVQPGQNVGFSVSVRDKTATGVLLAAGTIFKFQTSGASYAAALSALSPKWIGGEQTKVLSFDSTVVNALTAPGLYTPTVDFAGTDEYEELLQQSDTPLPTHSLNVVAMDIVDINNPSPVVRSHTYTVTVLVDNLSPLEASVTGVDLTFSGGEYNESFTGPVTVPALANDFQLYVQVDVLSSTPATTHQIGATVSGTIGGSPFSVTSGYLSSWIVLESATLVYIDGSLDPMIVSQGQTHGFKVRLRNDGEATVNLQSPETYLTFTDLTHTYTAALKTNTAVSAGQTVTAEFNADSISTQFLEGDWPVDLHLVGTENGGSYDSVLTLSNSVRVVSPAVLSYQIGTLAPTLVSSPSEGPFEIGVNNKKTAELVLIPDSTSFYFDGFNGYVATLNPNYETRIPNGPVTLTFQSAVVDCDPGTYFPVARIVGTENGIQRAFMVYSTDALVVQPAADVSIWSITALPNTITRDQFPTLAVAVAVRNSGATVRVDSAKIRLFLDGVNRSDRFVITPAYTQGMPIPAGPTVNLDFDLEDNSGNTMPIGNYTIESDVWVTDTTSSEHFHVTNTGNKGLLKVQAPGVLTIESIQAARTTVTQGQTGWKVTAAVQNTGEATIRLNLPVGASLDFDPVVPGWDYTAPDLPVSEDLDLIEGERDTLEFTITGTPAAVFSDIYRIGGSVSSTELNNLQTRTGLLAPVGGGSVNVQSPAELSLAVSPSRTPVTAGATQLDWIVYVDAANTGGSKARVDLDAAETQIQFSNDAAGFFIRKPPGNVDIPGGEEHRFAFVIDATGTVSPYGPVDIQATLGFEEINTGRTDTADSTETDAVTIQEPPNVQYQNSTLSPIEVSRGQDAAFFTLNVQNIPGLPATVVLTPAQTRVRFASFSATLNTDGETVIPGGPPVTLQFNSTKVDTTIPANTYAVYLDLAGTQNGNLYNVTLHLTDSVKVVEPSKLNIESILAGRSTVTQGQSSDWTVSMVVSNNGDATIDMDLEATRIQFVSAMNGDVSGEYDVTPPTKLDEFIDKRLPKGQTGTLTFQVLGVDTSAALGTIVLYGHAEGRDENSTETVSKEGVGRGFIVQKPAVLEITGTTVSQSPVTEGQTGWTVKIGVRNPDSQSAELQLELPDSAELTFAPPDPGWDYNKPETLELGDTTLGGGESGTLVFGITGTGAHDTYTIGSRVTAVELNRNFPLTASSGPETEGSVVVQDSADIQITGITMSRDTVTEGQTAPWTISADVLNNGGAGVLLSDAAERTYIEFPNSFPANARFDSPSGTLSLPGGQATTLTFTVSPTPDFGGVYGDQNFTVHIESNDVNSGDPVGAERTGTVRIELAPHPLYIVESLFPRTVKAGETAKFRLEVSERDGAAELELDPTRTRLSFGDGVHSPIRPLLDETFTTSIVAPGATIWFEEVLVLENYNEGTYPANVRLAGTHNGNDFDSTLAEFDNIVIQPPSAVGIDSLTVSQDKITENQTSEWKVWVWISNMGTSDVVIQPQTTLNLSIESDVTSSYTFHSDYFIEGTTDSTLGAGASGAVVFTVTQTGPQMGALRINAVVVARDVDADKLVSDNTATSGDWVYVQVQTAADLSVSAGITAPSDAVDGTVGTGQQFTLTATIVNDGQAAVDNSGQITLNLPPGFTVDTTTPENRALIIGDIDWLVTAPDSVSSQDTLEVAITAAPIEINTGLPAAVSAGSDLVIVDVEPLGAFSSLGFRISTPEGATDDTVSTDQQFWFETTVTANTTTADITAELVQLSGPTFYFQPKSIALPDGTGEPVTREWRLDVPGDSTRAEFYVRFEGRDENNPEIHPEAFTDTILVVVQRKAQLTVNAWISAPPGAKDGSVAVGTVFDVTARVKNPPENAGVDPNTEAAFTIDFSAAAEYGLDSGSPTVPFEVGVPVVWHVRAPQDPAPARTIVVRISAVPDDENSNSQAVVDTSQAAVSIQTDADYVTVDNISGETGLDTNVVPKGTPDIALLAIELANPMSTTGDAASIDRIDVTLLDKYGRPAPNPAATISGLYAQCDDQQVNGDTGQNPMIVDFGGIRMAPETTKEITFSVNITKTAVLDEMVLSIESSGDISITNAVSGLLIDVRDKNSLGPVEGKLRSHPLVILSDNFEEYAHNYPNPFQAGSQVTKIAYIMEKEAPLSVKIFDLTGSLVYERHYDVGEAGTRAGPQEVTWDGRNMNGEVVRNGLYICKLEAGGRSTLIRIAVAK